MSNIIWVVVIGFVAEIIARFLMPGENNPTGFIAGCAAVEPALRWMRHMFSTLGRQQPLAIVEPSPRELVDGAVWLVPAVGLVSVVIRDIWPRPVLLPDMPLSPRPVPAEPHGARLRPLLRPLLMPVLVPRHRGFDWFE